MRLRDLVVVCVIVIGTGFAVSAEAAAWRFGYADLDGDPSISASVLNLHGYDVASVADARAEDAITGRIAVDFGTEGGFRTTLGRTSETESAAGASDLFGLAFAALSDPGANPSTLYFHSWARYVDAAKRTGGSDLVDPLVADLISVIDNFLSPVPIPASLPLFGAAIAGLGILGWRRKRLAKPI